MRHFRIQTRRMLSSGYDAVSSSGLDRAKWLQKTRCNKELEDLMREESSVRKLWKMLDLHGSIEGILYAAMVVALAVLMVASSGLAHVDKHPMPLTVALCLGVLLSITKAFRKHNVRRVLPFIVVALSVGVVVALTAGHSI